MGFIRSSERYRIPKPTLKFHLHGKVLRGDSKNRLNDWLPTLLPEVEKEITAHTVTSKSCFFGMTFTDCRKSAYEVAKENGFKHVFNKDLKWLATISQFYKVSS
jgi:hypothetical protein